MSPRKDDRLCLSPLTSHPGKGPLTNLANLSSLFSCLQNRTVGLPWEQCEVCVRWKLRVIGG